MRIILFVSFCYFFFATHAQQTLPQPTKFKTAKQKFIEDSIAQINNPVVPQAPKVQLVRDYDTSTWGALAIVGAVLVLPQDEMKEITTQGFGYGIDGALLVNFARKRTSRNWERKWASIYAGAGLQYLVQGGVHNYYSLKDASSETNVASTIVNKMWGGRLIARIEVFPTQLKLFVEGSIGKTAFAGYHDIEAESSVKDINGVLSNPIIAETTYEHGNTWVSNYSYGAGVRIGEPTFKIEFKFINHIGQSINYIDLQSVQVDRTNSTIKYTTKPTFTNMWLPQVGVSYLF